MKPTKHILDKGLDSERTVWRDDHNQLHRVNGPAIIWKNGHQKWSINGKLHREDGPAIIFDDGEKSWFLNGKEYTEEEYNQEMYNRNLEKLRKNER